MMGFLAIDKSIFSAVHGLAGQWPWLDTIAIFCAAYLEHVLIGGAIVLALWPLEHIRLDKRMGRIAILALVGSYVVFKIGLPFLIQRARPFVDVADVTPLIRANPLEYYRSFPSGHAVAAFAIAWAIWLHNKKLGWWFLTGAILIAVSRVFVGVHWPSDVIAGALFGICGAYVAYKKVNRYPKFWSRFLS